MDKSLINSAHASDSSETNSVKYRQIFDELMSKLPHDVAQSLVRKNRSEILDAGFDISSFLDDHSVKKVE
jgi:hypothetical protein